MSKTPDWIGSIYTKDIGDIRVPLHSLTDEEARELKDRFLEEAAVDFNYNEKNVKHSKGMDRLQKASPDMTATAGRELKDIIEEDKINKEKLIEEMLEAANKTRKKDNN